MKKWFFILFCIVVSTTYQAQLFDSISSSLKHQPTPLLKLESRNAFITNSFIQTYAIKGGLNFNKTFKVGLGYSWLKQKHQQRGLIHPNDSTRLKIHTILAFAEYTYWQQNNWSSEIIVQLAGGNTLHTQHENIIKKTPVFIYEPAMLVDYRFLRYFSIGGGIGYRLVIKFNNAVKEQITSPIYIYRIKINFGRVWKDLKK